MYSIPLNFPPLHLIQYIIHKGWNAYIAIGTSILLLWMWIGSTPATCTCVYLPHVQNKN